MSNEDAVPDDECRKFYQCEKQKEACPVYQEYVANAIQTHTGTTSDAKQNAAAQAQIKQLQQLAICVEKFEEKKKGPQPSASKYQQAAFLLSTLWGVRDTLKISFMGPLPVTYPGDQPQWDGSVKRPETSVKPPPVGETGNETCASARACMDKAGPNFTCVEGMCVEDLMPLWYTRDQVTMNMHPDEKLTPEDEALQQRVRAMDPMEAIKHIVDTQLQPLLGLKFEWVEADGDIRISLDNRKGAWSMVGQQAKQVMSEEPTMNFGWLDVTTIIHEFCHAVGMIHEHQNPFGKGIDWNLKKVFAWASSTQNWNMYTTCQNITKRYNVDLVNGSNYDPKSIMLYSYPAALTNNGVATYSNIRLSDSDKEWLSGIYAKQGPRVFPGRIDKAAQTVLQNQRIDTLKKGGYVAALVIGVGALGAAYYYYVHKRRSRKK